MFNGHSKEARRICCSRLGIDSIRPGLDRCVCLLLQGLLQSCSRGGRGIVEDMCYERRRAEALDRQRAI